MSCPICGDKQREHGTNTMTCPQGHLFLRGIKPPVHRRFELVIPATVAATLVADLLLRTLT